MTPSMEKLASRLASLPGIGRKSAARLAYHILSMEDNEARLLSASILEVRESVTLCPVCQAFTESDMCAVCSDPNRDRSVICVVEDSRSMDSIEVLREYNGLYHILHGVISPIDGIGPEQLKIKELLARISDTGNPVSEIIVAANPSVEGEATSLYISRLLKPLGIKVTRLAYGLPVGASLEYTDSITLLKAFEGRTEV